MYTHSHGHATQQLIAVPWFRCCRWVILWYQIQTIDLQFQTQGRDVSIFAQSLMRILYLYISLSQLLMEITEFTIIALWVHVSICICNHTRVSPKPPPCNGNGSSCCPWLKINMCECVKCINVRAISISQTPVVHSFITPTSFMYTEGAWNKFGVLSWVLQLRTVTRVMGRRDDFTASQCAYWFVRMDYRQYVYHGKQVSSWI